MYIIDISHHYLMHNGKIIQYNGKIDRPKQPAKTRPNRAKIQYFGRRRYPITLVETVVEKL